MSYFVHAKKFYLDHGVEEGGYLEIQNNGQFGFYYSEDEKPKSVSILDFKDSSIVPGYVDTHIHGLMNNDVNDCNWDEINKISEKLLQYGVTSWIPTTVTTSSENLDKICKMFAAHKGQETGAKILGIHFEGPYFTKEHGGAENPEFMKDPSIEEFDKWYKDSDWMLRKISLAPERNNIPQFVRHIVKKGVVASLGHSSATYEEARKALDAGATMFNHTFNGMNLLSQHTPNIIGCALTADDLFDEMIADGHHIKPIILKMLFDLKGPDHIILITDCLRTGGMLDGEYVLSGMKVTVKNHIALLENGKLAGSTLTLDKAVRNLVNWEVCKPYEAIKMATYTPARSLNEKCGCILPDRDADFNVLDGNLNVLKTFVNGKERYSVK